jgi:hypothetical protein
LAAVNVAKLVAKNLKKYGKAVGVKSCTLIKVTPGIRTPGNLSGGTNAVETSYTASGFIENYSDFVVAQSAAAGSLIVATDRKIDILGSTLPAEIVPAKDDKISIADASGVVGTYRIVAPVTNPDGLGAVYVCQGRL